MTMEVFLQHAGQPVHICGYTSIYGALSVPLDRNDGMREVVLQGAFDHVLAHPSSETMCQIHHMDNSGVIGALADKTLRIWSDPYGLAFDCGPLDPTPINHGVVESILRGGVRGASWLITIAESSIETIDGEQVVAIRRVKELHHLGPVNGPAYPATLSWCSHESPEDMPSGMRAVVEYWSASRPAVHSGPTLMARAAPAQAGARRAADFTVPAIESIDVPDGFTRSEWLAFGALEHRGRREAKERERLKFENQRARRRQRDAGATVN